MAVSKRTWSDFKDIQGLGVSRRDREVKVYSKEDGRPSGKVAKAIMRFPEFVCAKCEPQSEMMITRDGHFYCAVCTERLVRVRHASL